jgi:hypothetical protein
METNKNDELSELQGSNDDIHPIWQDKLDDELMMPVEEEKVLTLSKPESYDVFFQFGENDPVKFATTYEGNHFSLTLNAEKSNCPEVNFTDGNGNHFKLFMQKCT